MKRLTLIISLLITFLLYSVNCFALATDLREYRNAEYGYSIMIPATFTVDTGISYPVIFHGKDSMAMINIGMELLDELPEAKNNPEQFFFARANKMAREMQGNILLQRSTILNDHEAYITIFSFPLNGEARMFIMESAVAGNKAYNLLAVSLPTDEYATLLSRSLSSFKW